MVTSSAPPQPDAGAPHADDVAPAHPDPSDLVPDPGAVDAEPAHLDPSAEGVEDLAGVLGSLLLDMRFAELAVALRSVEALTGAGRRRALSLCLAGARLLQLDAADFAEVEGVPADLRAAVLAMQFPHSSNAAARGSLLSLIPLYGLMLEGLEVYWARGDTVYVLTVLHLFAEYLPLLAWQSNLGHAGDPLALRDQVAGTLWATEECPMPRHRRAASKRVQVMDPESLSGGIHPQQWEAYLDRWHARVAGALRQCALRPGDGRPNPEDGGCDRDCGVLALARDVPELAGRMAVAKAFADSPVVSLRHSAPVGHFFGVPGRREVLAAWEETTTWLCRDWGGAGPHGGNPIGGGLEPLPGEGLPGLSALLGAVAGFPVRPTVLLLRLRDEVAGVLADLLDPLPSDDVPRTDTLP